jgi:hypothetical protein
VVVYTVIDFIDDFRQCNRAGKCQSIMRGAKSTLKQITSMGWRLLGKSCGTG